MSGSDHSLREASERLSRAGNQRTAALTASGKQPRAGWLDRYPIERHITQHVRSRSPVLRLFGNQDQAQVRCSRRRPNFEADFKMPPTALMLVAIRSQNGKRTPKMMKWGLIPHWAKDDKIQYSTHNARSEEFTTKPAFRDAWKRLDLITQTSLVIYGTAEHARAVGARIQVDVVVAVADHKSAKDGSVPCASCSGICRRHIVQTRRGAMLPIGSMKRPRRGCDRSRCAAARGAVDGRHRVPAEIAVGHFPPSSASRDD